MAGLTELEAFQQELFRPPHVARMLEHAGRYVERLDKVDKEKLLEDAMAHMFEQREQLGKVGVLKLWIEALDYAARRRPKWRTWFNVYESRWVKGTRLGRQS